MEYSYDDINTYIDSVINDNGIIYVGKVLEMFDSSNISYEEKCIILKKTNEYNCRMIKTIESQNEEFALQKYNTQGKQNASNSGFHDQSDFNETPSTNSTQNLDIHINVSSLLNHIKNCDDLSKIHTYLLSVISEEDFIPTINILIAKILSEVSYIKKLKNEELLSTGKECDIFDSELEKSNTILNMLLEIKQQDSTIESNNCNTLIYLTTDYGNINIANDLKPIPIEFYDSFYILLKSIQDGSFKNFKQIGSDMNWKINLSQVRENKTRVIFYKVENGIYMVSTLFVKKVQNSRNYSNHLTNTAELIYRQLPHVREQLLSNREEYIKLNKDITDALFEKLLTKDKGAEIDARTCKKSKTKNR